MPLTRKRILHDLYALQMVLARAMVSSRSSYLDALGMNRAQGEALFLIQYRECRTIGQLASTLGVTSGAATQVVESLEKLGLVERRRREDDKRVVELGYTDKGEQQLEEMKEYHFQRMEAMMVELTSEDLDSLMEIQLKILRGLQADPNRTK